MLSLNMAVPKRKTTPSKRNMRRSHHVAGTQLFAEDKKSGELRRPHHIDLSTGMYRGKQIIVKKPKKDKVIIFRCSRTPVIRQPRSPLWWCTTEPL